VDHEHDRRARCAYLSGTDNDHSHHPVSRSGGGAPPAVGSLRAGGRRPDVEVKDGGGQVQGRTRVRHIDDAAEAALDRGGAEQQVGLLRGVAELRQVPDGIKAGTLVGQLRVEVALVATFVDRDPTKVRNSLYRGSTPPGMNTGLPVTP
jgi:hypothetical protein